MVETETTNQQLSIPSETPDNSDSNKNESDVTKNPENIEPGLPAKDPQTYALEKTNLVDSTFTPEDARNILEHTTIPNNEIIVEEDATREKSPIFWLVAILSFLAVGIFIAWLVAK